MGRQCKTAPEPNCIGSGGDEHPGRIEIEILDITEPAQITALHDRLWGRRFEILFHNAGTANANPHESVAEVSTEEFVRVMVTNALSPMRVVDGLQDLLFRRTG